MGGGGRSNWKQRLEKNLRAIYENALQRDRIKPRRSDKERQRLGMQRGSKRLFRRGLRTFHGLQQIYARALASVSISDVQIS